MKSFVTLELDEGNTGHKDKVYNIINKYGDVLGKIYYYSKWRKYVFEPDTSTFYDYLCLSQVADLMKELKR